jgi:hypothetical protein
MTSIAAFIGRRRLARKHRHENEQILADARAAAVREGVAL